MIYAEVIQMSNRELTDGTDNYVARRFGMILSRISANSPGGLLPD